MSKGSGCVFVTTLRPSIHLNNFSSETFGPVFLKFLLEPSVNGGLKICTNGLGPLIKLAVMPIYYKTLKIFFCRTKHEG